MKDQYVGDINDYKKLGLIRMITSLVKSKIIMNWMLTESDGKTDGRFTEYLHQADKFKHFDSALFDALNSIVNRGDRKVEAIEKAGLIEGARYFRKPVPDNAQNRQKWFVEFLDMLNGSELVFFDPDNGIEIKSTKKGRKDSSKFVFWDEIEAVWKLGCTLLIYQHFPRVNREKYIASKRDDIKSRLKGASATFLSTSKVLFILITNENRKSTLINDIAVACEKTWKEQLQFS